MNMKEIYKYGNKKSLLKFLSEGSCGERGIRTPGTSRYGGFQDRCNRPLYHLSNAFIIAGRSMCLKSECKGIKFFWFRQTFVVFFSNYFRFPYPYAGKVVTLQYDLP